MELEDIANIAKQVVKEDGEHSPQFILESKGGLIMIAVPNYDQSAQSVLLKSLKETIDEKKVQRYWAVFSAWMIDARRSDKLVNEKFKEMRDKKMINEEDCRKYKPMMKKLLIKLAPSQHPARREILLVSEFDKRKGMKSIAYKYVTAENKSVQFIGKPQTMDGTMYSVWNVWNPNQIDFDDNGNVK